MSFDVSKIRNDFPALNQQINGKPLVYFDNGATTLKPQSVINSITDYYTYYSANVHRGVHSMSQKATMEFERCRSVVKDFINAKALEEVIYTTGTTMGSNLVARGLEDQIKKDDEIIISTMEHHSGIVPWQMVCDKKQAKLKVIELNDDGHLDLQSLEALLTEKTKIVAFVAISNSTGVINPLDEIISVIRKKSKALVYLDGAQLLSHYKVDVQQLDCDFLSFSAHKLFGPTGFGILYGKKDVLETLTPLFGGGDMIDRVTFEKTTYAELPARLEAGTPNIAGGIGLAAAIDYINEVSLENITNYEQQLKDYAHEKLNEIPGIKIMANGAKRVPVFSFVIDGIHSQDLGMILDQSAIAVRTGHHCTQPLLDHFAIESTTRASLSFYNTKEEIDRLVDALKSAIKIFA